MNKISSIYNSIRGKQILTLESEKEYEKKFILGTFYKLNNFAL